MKIKCIVIDDELPAIEQMVDYIGRVQFLECMSTFDNALDAVPYLKANPIDLIFLDIEMERFTGLQLLKTLRIKPKVVLTTAYDSYALDAFNLNVTDYLLKPISFERFIQAIEKVYEQFKTVDPAAGAPVYPAPRTWFFVRTEFRMQRVDFDDILFIEGMREYLGIQTLTQRIMVLQSFTGIMKSLPEENFFRVHKSFIVAVSKVDRVERNQIFIGNHIIPLSETYKAAFMMFVAGSRSDRLSTQKNIEM